MSFVKGPPKKKPRERFRWSFWFPYPLLRPGGPGSGAAEHRAPAAEARADRPTPAVQQGASSDPRTSCLTRKTSKHLLVKVFQREHGAECPI